MSKNSRVREKVVRRRAGRGRRIERADNARYLAFSAVVLCSLPIMGHVVHAPPLHLVALMMIGGFLVWRMIKGLDSSPILWCSAMLSYLGGLALVVYHYSIANPSHLDDAVICIASLSGGLALGHLYKTKVRISGENLDSLLDLDKPRK